MCNIVLYASAVCNIVLYASTVCSIVFCLIVSEFSFILSCRALLFDGTPKCLASASLSVCLSLTHSHITSLNSTLLPSHTSFFSLLSTYLPHLNFSFLLFFFNSVLCQQMASRLYDGIRTSIHGSRSHPLDDRTISTDSRESTIFHFCY